MNKVLYQFRIKESETNDYILGRISGMLDLYMYTGDKVKSVDVLHVDDRWIFNCKMDYETYLKVRNYITICYPDRNFEWYKFNNDQRIEA